MVRVLSILLVIALLVWGGEAYFSKHPPQEFWEWMISGSNSSTGSAASGHGGGSTGSASANGGSSSANGASPSATPDHTVATSRQALWKLTETLLTPLDKGKDYSPANTNLVLQNTQRDLIQYRSDPAFTRLSQACSVLGQLSVERQNYLQRYARDSATPTPTPAKGGLTESTLQPSYDLKPLGTNSTTFFRDRVAAEWHDRCNYYEPVIDGLLAPAN